MAATARAFTEEGGEVRIGLARLDGDEVLVDGSRVEADAFVFAAGPWLPKLLGPVAGLELSVPQQEVIYFHPTIPDAWVVGGGSGHGFKHGPALGEYLSALVMGDAAAAATLAPPDDRFALRTREAGIGMRTSGAAPPTG